MKICFALVAAIIIPPKVSAQSNPLPTFAGQQVEISFDKFNQKTHYSVHAGDVGQLSFSNGQKIDAITIRRASVLAGFDCPGQSQSCVPGVTEFVFSGHTSHWLLSDNREGLALVDGTRFDLGVASWDGKILEVDTWYKDLLEYLDFNISAAMLGRIANAREVSIQLGGFINFELSPQNLLALRSLAQHLNTADNSTTIETAKPAQPTVLTGSTPKKPPRTTGPAARLSPDNAKRLLINRVAPIYPALARTARVEGQVVLAAVVDKAGAIESLQAISGHPLLIPAAIEAVRQWRYKPFYLNGRPTAVDTTITVNFTLQTQ